ncbi:MAG: hypothetical protein R2699_03250 [Acidimicrobiales bacterium]
MAWRNGVLTVNGERLFAKGAAQDPLPSADAPSGCGAAQVVQLARDAGIDLLRLRAHVAQPELYAAADELGIMLWQDLPLRWGYARTVRAEARRLARATVDRLAPHPSVVAWCGHDQPLGPHRQDAHGPPTSGDHLARRVLRATAPRWSRTVLDLCRRPGPARCGWHACGVRPRRRARAAARRRRGRQPAELQVGARGRPISSVPRWPRGLGWGAS